jgi:hypothetical protein
MIRYVLICRASLIHSVNQGRGSSRSIGRHKTKNPGVGTANNRRCENSPPLKISAAKKIGDAKKQRNIDS